MTRSPGGNGQRVELANGKLSHACVACGRWCRDCRHEASYVPERCVPCSAPYADNAPADDGRVYCQGCDAPFPVALPPGTARYPRLCRSCREAAAERRGEAAEDRELDRAVGVSAVLDPAPRPTPADPLAPRPRGRPRVNRAPHQGGAVPPVLQADYATPDTPKRKRQSHEPSGLVNARKPSEFSGEAAHGARPTWLRE